MAKTTPRHLRIGDLARRSGVSAKALRLYEQRGLLHPAAHSAAGYRLYDAGSLAALSRIVVLRRAGFSLAEIGQLLTRDAAAAARLLDLRIATLERECAERAQALQALRSLARRVDSPSTLNLDELVETIAMSTQLKVDWTPREREDFRRRAEQLGETGMAGAQALWPELIAQVRAALDSGLPAQAPEAQELARRWYALVQVFSGGNAEVTRKLGQAWQAQPDAMAAHGLDPALFAYVGEALRAAGLGLA
jgi:DNA-binding transcriptional MerR regulator